MTLKNKKMDGNCLVEEEKDTLEFCVTLGTFLPLAVTVSPAHCTSAPHETMGTDNPAVHLVTPRPWLLDSAVYCFRGWGGAAILPVYYPGAADVLRGPRGPHKLSCHGDSQGKQASKTPAHK